MSSKKSTDNTMIQCEIAWKNAKTFDIFSLVWDVKGIPLADQRRDIQGFRYNRCSIPKRNLTRLQKKLIKVDPNATFFLTTGKIKM